MKLDRALERAHEMVGQGAEIIDSGGESTRPGAEPVSVEEELRRILPVVKQLKKEIYVPLSIDTYKPEVARQCLDLGASIINDVSGLRNSQMVKLAVKYSVPIVIMHMPGTPQTMMQYANYQNVTDEVKDFFRERIALAQNAGIDQIILDPGLGFGKTPEQNYQLISELSSFKEFGYPIMIGPSRKRFLSEGVKVDLLDILAQGTLNGADIIRMHDVNLGVGVRYCG